MNSSTQIMNAILDGMTIEDAFDSVLGVGAFSIFSEYINTEF